MSIKVDAREWNKTFQKYLQARKTAREDVIKQKARDFAFKAFQQIDPTAISRIQSDLLRDKLILKLSVIRLMKQGVSLKGKALSTKRRRVKGGGTKKPLTPGNKLVSQYARKLLLSRKRSAGYHRVAYLLLAQKMGRSGSVRVNPRSMLNRTNVKERNSANNTVVTLNAVARGLDCPSTQQGADRALEIIGQEMKAFIAKRLAEARKQAGFR